MSVALPVTIRDEAPAEAAAVFALHAAAFPGDAEARLVDALRARARPLVSLVAENAGAVCGHILFSPVSLAGFAGGLLMGLAPMAVMPALQNRGIGSALVRAGLARCAAIGALGVVVLGHPEYYPRFGFRDAADFGLGCEYDVPPGVFMALELTAGALRDAHGTVRYHAAFAAL